jgi:Ca-activated chloride channel homolog
MTFEWPWMLLALLALPLLVAEYRRLQRRRGRRRAELAALGLVAPGSIASASGGAASGKGLGRRRHVAPALFLAALALLLLGLARPQATIAEAHREGTVILAFDVSGSMAATDLAPSRLAAAKTDARAFVQRQPSTIKLGVVAFGAIGLVTQAPTTDKNAVLAAIDRLSPQGGTSLGRGIQTALSAIAGKPVLLTDPAGTTGAQPPDPGYHGSSAVILLSDGENTSDPDPLTVARVASVAGVKVYPIGLGSPAGTVLQIDGFQVATKLDQSMLQQIASTTDGQYYAASDEKQLASIYGSINPTWKIEAKHEEITALFAAAAAVLLMAGAGLSIAWFGRVI